MRISTLAAALILAISCLGHAQTKRVSTHPSRTRKPSWQVFAPAGKSFKVQVPAKPRRIVDLYGDTDPKGYKAIDVYGVSQPVPIGRTYQIIVLVPSENMRRENPHGNELGGLEFTIGGDDAEPTSQSNIMVNGFKGREFIYDLGDVELPHRKGRIIDLRAKIFILIYATNVKSDLNSSAATRFFNSFKTL